MSDENLEERVNEEHVKLLKPINNNYSGDQTKLDVTEIYKDLHPENPYRCLREKYD